jgi:acetyl-CoA carboxylase biotin carboxylase subunit
MFKKILVANRGEIAVRIIRACRELGIPSVAVYSDVDRTALHVRKADEAYAIGPASAAESYLNSDKIVAVAKQSGSTAIHPGYGFLAENASFARACGEAGIRFIGPSPLAIEIMGSKIRARQEMERAGIRFVPGTSRPLGSLEEARQVAAQIGYPVMLKAAAGGGGKGMRLVASAEELAAAFESAKSEALRGFGDEEVYLEKAIVNPRHVEIQILADEHGHAVYVGERECSLQRRHQKVLEECPSPAITPLLRKEMGETAVRAAQAAKYSNAGTVEFLLEGKNFYFLEMNTRLQVEHPVTELTSGLDLVELQIQIAEGKPLPFEQKDISLRGHAIECRIYAEDPDNNYFPSPGKITLLEEPSGPGIRLDSGIYEGWTVPLDYDPLLAKLVSYGSDREQAMRRMARALDEYFVAGIKTNLPLFRRILADADFRAGRFDTGYLDRLGPQQAPAGDSAGAEVAAVAAGLFALEPGNGSGLERTSPAEAPVAGTRAEPSHWTKLGRSEALR